MNRLIFRFLYPMSSISLSASIFMTVSVTVERYWAVCKPAVFNLLSSNYFRYFSARSSLHYNHAPLHNAAANLSIFTQPTPHCHSLQITTTWSMQIRATQAIHIQTNKHNIQMYAGLPTQAQLHKSLQQLHFNNCILRCTPIAQTKKQSIITTHVRAHPRALGVLSHF